MVVDNTVRNGGILGVWDVEATEFVNGTDY